MVRRPEKNQKRAWIEYLKIMTVVSMQTLMVTLATSLVIFSSSRIRNTMGRDVHAMLVAKYRLYDTGEERGPTQASVCGRNFSAPKMVANVARKFTRENITTCRLDDSGDEKTGLDFIVVVKF